jgi:hypothetical protein
MGLPGLPRPPLSRSSRHRPQPGFVKRGCPRNKASRDAQDFNTVIYVSFAAMAVVYGLVAGLGYYYFGDAASTLVTNDLTNNSPYTGHWVRPRRPVAHRPGQTSLHPSRQTILCSAPEQLAWTVLNHTEPEALVAHSHSAVH